MASKKWSNPKGKLHDVPFKSELKYMIQDEEQTAKLYKRYGYNQLAKDELKHAKFLKKQKKLRYSN